MPKQKTKSGAKKRFKFTANGHVKVGQAGGGRQNRHLVAGLGLGRVSRLMHAQHRPPRAGEAAEFRAHHRRLRRSQFVHRVQIPADALSQDLEQDLVHTSNPLAPPSPTTQSRPTDSFAHSFEEGVDFGGSGAGLSTDLAVVHSLINNRPPRRSRW